LIIVALVLLGGFVVVMGGLSLQPTFTIFVDFENPGGLQSGAPVRISGVRVGRVGEVQFRGGELDPKTRELTPPIRIVTEIESRYQRAIHRNARFYVTSQGVLGEMFLAIEPGSPELGVLEDGAVVRGISPPRLDLLLAEGYELLHKAYLGIAENEQQIKETFDGLHQTLRGTGALFDKHRDRLDTIVGNVEKLTEQANATLAAARERYVDGPQATRIMNNVERGTTALGQDLPPLLRDGRDTLTSARRLTDALADEQQLARYRSILQDLGQAAENARLAAGDAQRLMHHVKRGEGTIGGLMMDEAIYDDLQEMLRDLKHNPWKFFWRQ
jgi:phospholipid/cholesterol/gamma-HCH transport system substrate-binding protein